jgi:hypothetical protein
MIHFLVFPIHAIDVLVQKINNMHGSRISQLNSTFYLFCREQDDAWSEYNKCMVLFENNLVEINNRNSNVH